MHKPLLSLIFLLCLGFSVSAQAPANDSCANAIQVMLDEVVDYSTINATTDGPNHMDCFGENDSIPYDVWFYYVADTTAELSWNNCSTADYDSRMAVYLAAPGDCPVGDAQLIECNDDGGSQCANFTSDVEFEVMAGQTYLLRVGGFGSEDSISFGSGTVVLEFAPDRPENDDCDEAIEVFLGTGQQFETTTASTDGPDHPDNPCFGFGSLTADNDIWYTFTPDFTGSVLWSTCDMINFDSRLAVYTPGSACPVEDGDLYACNDDGPGCTGFSSSLIFDVEAGMTYLLRLGGFGGDSGIGTFDLIEIVPPEPPANDMCMAADTSYIISREDADEFNVLFEGNTENGTFVTEDYVFPVCLSNQNGGEFADVWYKFNSLGNTEIEVRLNAVDAGGIFYLDLFESCGQMVDTSTVTSICINTVDNSFAVDTFGILPDVATEYWVRVSTRLTSDAPGPFWFQLVADIVSDVEEAALESFKLFPNPSADYIRTTFGMESSARVRYQVFNTLGQSVMQQDYGLLNQGNQDLQLDVSNLPSGIYILNIDVDEKQKTVKFVKQ